MRRTSVLLATALIATLAAPASAHRQWLLPSTTTLADTSQYVTIDAATSNDLFYADHRPMQTDQIKVWTPDGAAAAIENAATGRYRSTFDVKIDKPGTWKIGTEQQSVMGSFKVDGQEWRVGGRRPAVAPGGQGGAMQPAAAPGAPAPRPSVASVAEIPANATDVKLTEVISRNLVFVTAGAPTATVFGTGKGLALQPVSHPGALVADEEAQFRYLVDGKPAAGVKVAVVPGGKKFRDSEGAQELTTGPDGLVRIKWPTPGMYWVSATTTDTRTTEPRATERRMTFTTTVEVVAP